MHSLAVLLVVWFATGAALVRQQPLESLPNSPSYAGRLGEPQEKAPRPARATCTADATLGLEAGPITPAIRTRLAIPADVTGVVVTHVFDGGPAALAGVRPDDVVVAVAGNPVATECALVGDAWNRECDDTIVVAWRGGQSRALVLALTNAMPMVASRCEAGDARACYRQAWLQWSRDQSPDGRKSALSLYERSCQAGSAEGCAHYGVALGEASAPVARQREAFDRACTLRDGSGCAHLAYLYATGDGVMQDHARATDLYEQACTLGDPMGCYNVGLNYENGRGVSRDDRRAVAAYELGCDGGSPMACTNLGGLLRSEALGKPDPVRAVQSWQRGCDGSACQGPNLLGCVNLARAFRDGIGGPADPGRAVDLLGAVCDNSIDNAVPAATQQVKACALLGGMHLAGTAPSSSAARGRQLSERSCDDGDPFGCFNAATAHANGLGGAVDESRAASYFDAGCTAGDMESCDEMARRLDEGRGVTRDPARARTLRALACSGGFEKACAPGTRRQ